MILLIVEMILFSFLGTMLFLKEEVSKPMNFMTDDFCFIQIVSAKDNGYRQVTESVKRACKNDFVIAYEYTFKGRGGAVFYSSPGLFSVDLTEGRVFSQKDFDSRRNVAMVNDAGGDMTTVAENGKEYLVVDERKYEIIGRFHQPDSFNTKDWYISMLTDNLKETYPDGAYLFSSRNNTSYRDAKRFEKDYSRHLSSDGHIVVTKHDSEEGREYIFQNYAIVYIMLGGAILVIILNSFSAVRYWVAARKGEVAVRRLVGATGKNIFRWLLGEFMATVMCCSVAGFLFSHVALWVALKTPSEESVRLAFGEQITMHGAALGFGFLMLMGFLNIMICLKHELKEAVAGGLKSA